ERLLPREGNGGRTTVEYERTQPAPAVVRRQFRDLGIGAPPSLAPQAVVGESRTVGVFRAGGKRHVLWVAPTRPAGFCWEFSRASGGCIERSRVHGRLLSAGWLSSSPTDSIPARVDGVVLTGRASRITAVFRD